MDCAYDNSKPGFQVKVRAADVSGRRDKGQYSCTLCGEPVKLFKGGIQKPHFRHKRGSIIAKMCDLYAGSLSEYSEELRRKVSGLPFYLKQIGDSFQLYLGLWPIDESTLTQELQWNQKATVRNAEGAQIGYIDLTNIYPDEIYRLPISWIYDSYELGYGVPKTYLAEKWGGKTPGIFSSGVFFRISDTYSRNVSLNGIITTNTDYYLLSQHPVSSNYFLEVKESYPLLARNPKKWRVYKVQFTKITDAAAKYARDRHAQLLEKPPELTPLWPPCIQDNQKHIHQNTGISIYRLNSSYRHGKWEITILDKYRKPSDKREIYLQEPVFPIEVDSNVQYLSFFDTDNDLEVALITEDNKTTIPYQQPTLELKWMKQLIEPGIELKAIKNADLSIKSNMKCDIIRTRNHIPNLIFRDEISIFSFPDVSNGDTIIIRHGLDILTSLSFRSTKKNAKCEQNENLSDDALYLRLRRLRGTATSVPTQLKYIVMQLEKYPKTQEYLKKSLKKNLIPNKTANYLLRCYEHGEF